MKNKRQNYILDIINKYSVNTQDDILDALKSLDIEATQATVSRDIKELGIIKTIDKNGQYRYSSKKLEHNTNNTENNVRYDSIFRDSVISIAYAQNIIVVKCYTGMGNAACAALENMNIIKAVGMLAGDDTFFIVVADVSEAKKYEMLLNSHLKNMVG